MSSIMGLIPKDSRPVIVLSNNRVEIKGKEEYTIEANKVYDLIHVRTNELIKTVKGSTILKYIQERKFNILNLRSNNKYIYRKDCDVKRPIILCRIDFTHKEPVIKDLGLNNIELKAKKHKNDNIAIHINGRLIHILTKTQGVNPLESGLTGPFEENIITIIYNNVKIEEYSIGYCGKVENVELQTLDGVYTLKINQTTKEPGPTPKLSTIINL